MRLDPVPVLERPADLDLLLEEPRPEATGHWLAAIYARLRLASGGPVTLVPHPRLERAGWPALAPGADLAAARSAAWPLADERRLLEGTVGSPAPRLVLVGERAPHGQAPFHSRSGLWLWRAVRLLGHDELACLATNAYAGKRRPRARALAALAEALAPVGAVWVALGHAAAEVLEAVGHPFVAAASPHSARFAHAAGVEAYAVELRAAGVPPGPWLELPLPVVPSPPRPRDEGPALAARLGLPLTVAYTPTRPRVSPRRPPAVARARQLFVTGAAADVAAAARAARAPERSCHAACAKDGWARERDDHLARLRERAKAEAGDAEVKAAVQARRLAWSASLRALGSVARRLESGALEPSPQQAEALVRAALALAEATPGDDGSGALSPLEHLRGVVDAVRAQFGHDYVERIVHGETKPGAGNGNGAVRP